MVASRLTTSIIHFLFGGRKNPWVLGAKKKEWACENRGCNRWPASRKTRAGDEDRDCRWSCRWCSTCSGSDGGSGRCCLITGFCCCCCCCCLVFRGWCVLLVRGIALCHLVARSIDAGSNAWHLLLSVCTQRVKIVDVLLILWVSSSVWDLATV